jgi:hypothetical protein
MEQEKNNDPLSDLYTTQQAEHRDNHYREERERMEANE